MITPDGDKGEMVYRATEPLVQLRASQFGLRRVEPFVIQRGTILPRNRTEAEGAVWSEGLPQYLLLAGGVEDISFDAQRALMSTGRRVGRLMFPRVSDYGMYATNVVAWEKQGRACADLAYLMATGASDVGFWMHNLGERRGDIEAPSAAMHPLQLMQWALLRANQPLSMYVRLPVGWLVGDRSPADVVATLRPHQDLGSLTGALRTSSLQIATRSNSWRLGHLLSSRTNEHLNDELWAPTENGRQMATMLVGDPAMLMSGTITP